MRPTYPTFSKFSATTGIALTMSVCGLSAQDASPVRSLGQTSPGMTSLTLESDGLRTRTAEVITVPTADHDAPLPWWEGAEETALATMNPQRFVFGASVSAGWEYDDRVYLSDILDGSTNSYFARSTLTGSYQGGAVSFIGAYSPEYRMYDGEGLDDAFSQAASAGLTYTGVKSSAGLTVNLTQTDGANVEVGDRVDAITMVTALQGVYQLSLKTNLGGSVMWEHYDYDEFTSYDRYSFRGFTDYEFSEKTSIGLGGGYEFTEISEGLNSDAVNAALRATWEATSKVSLRGNAGYEWRQFDGGESLTSPIFSIGLLYNPLAKTSVSLDAYRRNNPSIREINQSYYGNGVVVSLTQNLKDNLSLSLSTGYELSEYEASIDTVAAEREDKYWYVRPQLTYTFLKKASISVYYQYSENDSTDDSLSFDRNLFGATLSFEF